MSNYSIKLTGGYGKTAMRGVLAWTGPMTIEGWVKTTMSSGGFSKAILAYVEDYGNGYRLITGNDDSGTDVPKAVAATWSTNGYWVIVKGNTPINDGNWHHVGMVYDGTYLHVYCDGQEDAAPEIVPNGVGWPGNGFDYLGSVRDNPLVTYQGNIDELRYYHRALSLSEIQKNYNNGEGLYTPYSTQDLICWWHFDDGPGNINTKDEANDVTIGLNPTYEWDIGWVVEYPTIVGINPNSTYRPHPSLSVRITGQTTSFNSTSVPKFTPSTGITVLSANAINSTTLDATLAISSDASLGSRDVTVTTNGIDANPLENGFTINDPPTIYGLSGAIYVDTDEIAKTKTPFIKNMTFKYSIGQNRDTTDKWVMDCANSKVDVEGEIYLSKDSRGWKDPTYMGMIQVLGLPEDEVLGKDFQAFDVYREGDDKCWILWGDSSNILWLSCYNISTGGFRRIYYKDNSGNITDYGYRFRVDTDKDGGALDSDSNTRKTGVDLSQPVRVNVQPNTQNIWVMFVDRTGQFLISGIGLTEEQADGSIYIRPRTNAIVKKFLSDDTTYTSSFDFPINSDTTEAKVERSSNWVFEASGGGEPNTYLQTNSILNRWLKVTFYGTDLQVLLNRTWWAGLCGVGACEDQYTKHMTVILEVTVDNGKPYEVRVNQKSDTWITLAKDLKLGTHIVYITIKDVIGLDWGWIPAEYLSFIEGDYCNSEYWQNNWYWARMRPRGQENNPNVKGDGVFLRAKPGVTYGDNWKAFWTIEPFISYPRPTYLDSSGNTIDAGGHAYGNTYPVGYVSSGGYIRSPSDILKGIYKIDFMVEGKAENFADYTSMSGWQAHIFRTKYLPQDINWVDYTYPILQPIGDAKKYVGQLKYMGYGDIYSGYDIVSFEFTDSMNQSFNFNTQIYHGSTQQFILGGKTGYFGRRVIDMGGAASGVAFRLWRYGGSNYFTSNDQCPYMQIRNIHARFKIKTPREFINENLAFEGFAYTLNGFLLTIKKFRRIVENPIYGKYGTFQFDDAIYGRYEARTAGSESYCSEWLILGKFSGTNADNCLSRDYFYENTGSGSNPTKVHEYEVAKGVALKNDYDYGPAMYKQYIKNGSLTWSRFVSPEAKVDLISSFGGQVGGQNESIQNCCAYAFSWVYVENGGKYKASIGVDDGFKLWINGGINGQPNKTVTGNRGYKSGEFEVDIDLNDGWNSIMLKISNGVITDGQNRWEFSFKLKKPSGLDLDAGECIYSTEREYVDFNPIIIYDNPEEFVKFTDKQIKFIEGNYVGEDSSGNWVSSLTNNVASIGTKKNVTYGYGWASQIVYSTTSNEEGYVDNATVTLSSQITSDLGWVVQVWGVKDRNLGANSFEKLLEYTTLKDSESPDGNKRIRINISSGKNYVGLAFRLRYIGSSYQAQADWDRYLMIKDLSIVFKGCKYTNINIAIDQACSDIHPVPFDRNKFQNSHLSELVKFYTFVKEDPRGGRLLPKYASRATLLDYANSLFVIWQDCLARAPSWFVTYLSNSTSSFSLDGSEWEHDEIYSFNSKSIKCNLMFDAVQTSTNRFLLVSNRYDGDSVEKRLSSVYTWTWWLRFVPHFVDCPFWNWQILAAEAISNGEVVLFMRNVNGNIHVSTSYTQTDYLKITDYIQSIEINSSDERTSNSATIRFINEGKLWSPNNASSPFYGWLPKDLWDRIPRRAHIKIGIKPALSKGYTWKSVFTGLLGGYNESVEYNNIEVPITCLDYAQQMAKYRTPETLIYAPDESLWADDFSGLMIVEGKRVKTTALDDTLWERTRDYSKFYVNPYYRVAITTTGGVIEGKPCVSSVNKNIPETGTVTYAMSLKFINDYASFAMGLGDESAIEYFPSGNVWKFKDNKGKRQTLFSWMPPLGEFFTIQCKVTSSGIYFYAGKKYGKISYKYQDVYSHRMRLYMYGAFEIHQTSITRGAVKVWEDVARDIYYKAFQGVFPAYSMRIEEGLYTIMNAPFVWPINQTASEALNRLCIVNGTEWFFDEEGTFVYRRKKYDRNADLIIDDDSTANYQYEYSTFDYLNWIEARGGRESSIKATAAFPESVANDGIRFELLEDSGLTDKDVAYKKALGELYSSLNEVEQISFRTLLPRLDINCGDVINLKIESTNVEKQVYIKSRKISFDVGENQISTTFTGKGVDVELYSQLSEEYRER